MSGDATRSGSGDIRDAIERAAAAIRRDPADARGWAALGSAYFALGQHDDAEQALRRARVIDPADLDTALRYGAALLELGRALDALAVTRDAAARHPRSADAHFIVGNAHAALGEHSEAAEAFARAARSPDAGFDARRHVASLAPGVRAGSDPIFSTPRALDSRCAVGASAPPTVTPAAAASSDARSPGDASGSDCRVASLAHYNRALALDELGRWDEAARACEAALTFNAQLWPALAQLVFLKRRLCEWDGIDALSARLRAAVADERDGITPFSFLAELATPAEQLRCATTWARSIVARTAGITVGGAKAPTAQRASEARSVGAFAPPTVTMNRPASMRIGFVSSGFNNHPTALLTVELIERLRESSITTIGFATTASDGGALRRRISAAFHEFVELDRDTHPTMAQRIRDARIDVLLDLRGYGGGSVSEVFAQRPCALQVNWLAYPGTSGAPFIDVMIADAFVVPAFAEQHYSERVVRMPHAFQPCDTTRAVAAPPSRAECGLPLTGTVFASFNNSYKISPSTFACWMRILAAAPGSVLWLLSGKDAQAAATNLRTAAAQSGIDPERLVFMRKLPHLDYLSRYAHVDLFLDTWPYNAHTTASDALFTGCPVLTLPGETFASRVAGSLVTTLGLDALVARDPDDYVSRALAVARDARAWRARVAAAKAASPLFDMRRYAADFEALLRPL